MFFETCQSFKLKKTETYAVSPNKPEWRNTLNLKKVWLSSGLLPFLLICFWPPLTWAKPGSPLLLDPSINNLLATSVASNQENPTEIIPTCIPFQSPAGLKKIQVILDTKGFWERIVVMPMIERMPLVPKSIIPQLEEIIANKTEPFGIRNSAIQALAKKKTVSPKTQSVLNQIIQDSSENRNLRIKAIRFLGEAGPQITESWSILEQLMKTDDSAQIRDRALMALALIEPDNQGIQTQLFHLVKKGPGKTSGKDSLWDNATKWQEAVNTFVALDQKKQVLGEIRSLLAHQSSEIRRRTVASLREIMLPKPRKISLLQRALKDRSRSVQEQVLNVLRQTNISLPHSQTLLLGILKDQDKPLRIRGMIPGLLEAFKSDVDSILPHLINRANDVKEDVELRMKAIQSLGKIGKKESEQPSKVLMQLAQNDQDNQIRARAWFALAHLRLTTPDVVQGIFNVAQEGVNENTGRLTKSTRNKIQLSMEAISTLFQIDQQQKGLSLALLALEPGNRISLRTLKLIVNEAVHFRLVLPKLIQILRKNLDKPQTRERKIFLLRIMVYLIHIAPDSIDVKELLQEIVSNNSSHDMTSQAKQGLMSINAYAAGEYFCQMRPYHLVY